MVSEHAHEGMTRWNRERFSATRLTSVQYGLDHSGEAAVLVENGEVALTDKAGYSGIAAGRHPPRPLYHKPPLLFFPWHR